MVWITQLYTCTCINIQCTVHVLFLRKNTVVGKQVKCPLQPFSPNLPFPLPPHSPNPPSPQPPLSPIPHSPPPPLSPNRHSPLPSRSPNPPSPLAPLSPNHQSRKRGRSSLTPSPIPPPLKRSKNVASFNFHARCAMKCTCGGWAWVGSAYCGLRRIERLGLVSARLPRDGVRTAGTRGPVHVFVHVHTRLVLNERF